MTKPGASSEAGFSLIELLVALTVFGIITGALYSLLFSSTRAARTSRSLVRISEDARLALNRMVRDTREAGRIENVSPTAYTVQVDFNGDGAYQNTADNVEILRFAYDAGAKTIALNGQPLVRGVEPLGEMFTYSSNLLDYDFDGNGVTTWQELDQAGCASNGGLTHIGNCDGIANYPDLASVSNVTFSLRVTNEKRTSVFRAEAQMRNRR